MSPREITDGVRLWGFNRYDQITYTMLDGPDRFGGFDPFDPFGFELVDWDNPALLSRRRRASSRLSSLPTENDNDENESEFGSDDEDGPVARKRKRTGES